jgi:phosphoglycolate phosphatase-like HAD superfamily hydrolase
MSARPWVLVLLLCAPRAWGNGDPLPSWNAGPIKQALIDFSERGEEKLAVFDQDGTLWVEQPIYTQLAFAIDRVKALAPKHPEWKTQAPFKAILDNDTRALLASGEKGVLELLAATHAGMTTDAFSSQVSKWLASARHPRFKRPYTELIYQPMLELISHLKDKGFRVYIVSGGGIEFMRVYCERVYGIPPENVIGSSGKLAFEERADGPVLMRLPEVDFVSDKEGKPVAIEKFTGRRPVFAAGNSDGDLQMLEWTTKLAILVHHTDAKREFAYDRDSHIGRLDVALSRAAARGWLVVDMKRDWKVVFPFDERK